MWKAYEVGFAGGIASEQRKLSEINEATEARIVAANKKILDLQRIIAYNNDECFNRVWPDDIVEAVNPNLRKKQ